MIKRTFDFTCALIGLIALSPLLLLLALLIWLGDRRSPFFVHVRIGRGGRAFGMLKFRTMRVGADKTGPSLTIGADARITPVGKLLRKTKLDELPQLWNVLIGDMTLVGPRPEVEKYVKLYSAEQRRVLNVRPGITDVASNEFFNEGELLASAENPEKFYIEEIMPKKIQLNLAYMDRANLLTDIGVIFDTFAKMLC
jgi:lipopolysaccharide/colanic/teichoic acid biosynthesis glycosyltransferase